MNARVLLSFLIGCLLGGGAVLLVRSGEWSAKPASRETAPASARPSPEAADPEVDTTPVVYAEADTTPVAVAEVDTTPVVYAEAEPVETVAPAAVTPAPPPVVEAGPVQAPGPDVAARRTLARRVAAATHLEFLEAIDPEYLDAGEARIHRAYVEAMRMRESCRAEVGERQRSGEAVTDDAAVSLRRAEAAVAERAAAERHALFTAAARSVGLDGEAAQTFALTLWSVVQATDVK